MHFLPLKFSKKKQTNVQLCPQLHDDRGDGGEGVDERTWQQTRGWQWHTKKEKEEEKKEKKEEEKEKNKHGKIELLSRLTVEGGDEQICYVFATLNKDIWAL